MAKRSDLVELAQEAVQNNGVYIGTANGVSVLDLTIRDIFEMEKAYGRSAWRNDIKRDLNFIGKLIANGVSIEKALAGDCSGIIVAFLRQLGLIKPTADYAARHFQNPSYKLTKVVALTALKPGDLVFDKKSEATHVGIYLGDHKVFESRGRDYGMVIRDMSAGPWVIGGSFLWWEDDAEIEVDEYVFSRNLKYIAGNQMKGEDVSKLQTKLAELGLYTDKIDGSYGKNTTAAVIRFQQTNGLTPDGIAGSKTIKALGFKYA